MNGHLRAGTAPIYGHEHVRRIRFEADFPGFVVGIDLQRDALAATGGEGRNGQTELCEHGQSLGLTDACGEVDAVDEQVQKALKRCQGAGRHRVGAGVNDYVKR